MSELDSAADMVLRGLLKAGYEAFRCSSERLPDLVVISEKVGILAVQVSHKGSDTSSELAERAKKIYVRNLRREVGDEERTWPIKFMTLFVDDDLTDNKEKEYFSASWFENLQYPDTQITSDMLLALRTRFNPELQFATKRRLDTDDPFKSERESVRFSLDSEQAAGVFMAENVNLLVQGPPGSGKTLVLIARAKSIARKHRSWQISVVVFTKTLKQFLESEFDDLPNISTYTFHEYQTKWHGYFQINETDAGAMRQYRQLVQTNSIAKSSDAIFIDEVQDFKEGWLRFLLDSVKPDCGGVTFAGDLKQSLYGSFDHNALVDEYNFQRQDLLIPYRSTRQILEFVQALAPSLDLQSTQKAPNGPLPSLVYVQPDRTKASLAEAVAKDIHSVLMANPRLNYSDVVVLCTTHYVMRSFAGQFRDALQRIFERDVPTEPIWRNAGYLLSMKSNSIKLVTINSAKGLEFSHVALIGLEGVPDQEEGDLVSAGDYRGTYYLVGPTRAKDTLCIYYSKDNVYLNRLVNNQHLFQMRSYPEDY